jgi:ubiquinone/menaquinone biosynthesis C-methylase UbiE
MKKIIKRLLQSKAPVHTNSTKTAQDLFDFLQSLYIKELTLTPSCDYLQVHSAPSMIADHILLFIWYLKWFPLKGAVLDWGCNHAPDSNLLRFTLGDSFSLHACDFRDPSLFPVFSKTAKMEYRQISNPIQIPYENETFDVIIASGSLEHTPMDFESLKELYRVMKTGGKLIITYLPNKWSWREWKLEKAHKNNLGKFHMRRYGMSETKWLLKHYGFYPIIAEHQSLFQDYIFTVLGFNNPTRATTKIFAPIFPQVIISTCLKFVAEKVSNM